MAVDRDAIPLAQRVVLADSDVRDLDGRIAQLDAMVNTATGRGSMKTAIALVGRQSTARAALLTEHQRTANRLADLRVQQANLEAQRARITADVGPALDLAKLFGSDDTEAVVRLITALLVLVLDPLAVLLTLAASQRPIGLSPASRRQSASETRG